jgi:hypothetical protein
MALAALWIGVASTLLWIGMMFWWNTHVRGLLLHGPQDAIRAGMAGDIAAFRGAFIGEGATASDDRARVFLDALQQRYGRLVSAAQEQSPATPTPPAAQPATSAPATILQPPASQPGQFSGRSATVPYMLMFEGGNVKADVRITLFAHGLAPAFEWITVKDASQGNLTYP